MKRLIFAVVGALVGWIAGTLIALPIDVLLASFRVDPSELLGVTTIEILAALVVLPSIVAGAVLGYRKARDSRRTLRPDWAVKSGTAEPEGSLPSVNARPAKLTNVATWLSVWFIGGLVLVIVGGFFIAAGVDFVDQGYSDDGVANILAGSIISTLGSLLILVAVLAKAVQVGLRSVTFNGTTFERRVEPKQWSISRPSP